MLSAHGVSVKQLIALQEEGKIQIILAGQPRNYIGLDYLDPILRLKPPSYTFRVSAYAVKRHGIDSWQNWQKEGQELFIGKLERLRKAVKVVTDQPAFEGSVVGAYLNMRTLGLDFLADSIKFVAKEDPFTAGLYLDLFHEIICAPITSCIKGSHTIPTDYMNTVKLIDQKIGQSVDARKTNLKKEFPTEVGKLLIERYHLIRPKTMQEALEIYPDYKEARNALMALTECVDKNNTTEIQPLANNVNKVFEQVYKIKSRKKTVETAFQFTGVIGAAALGLTGKVEGFLGAIGFGLFGSALASPLADSITKFNLPSSVVTLYDFEGKMSQRW